MRRVGKVNELSAQADAPSAVTAAMHDVEECLVANLVEIQRAAADGGGLSKLCRHCFFASVQPCLKHTAEAAEVMPCVCCCCPLSAEM